jgi:hypothetical protein
MAPTVTSAPEVSAQPSWVAVLSSEARLPQPAASTVVAASKAAVTRNDLFMGAQRRNAAGVLTMGGISYLSGPARRFRCGSRAETFPKHGLLMMAARG